MPREANPQEATAVEGMNVEQFQAYLETRRGCISALSVSEPNYAAKRKLLQYAVDNERSCAEHLRTVSALTVQADAAGANLTVERRTALLVSLRQALFNAKNALIFTKLITTDGFHVAYNAIGGGADDDLLSNDEKKQIEEARKKSKSQDSSAAGSSTDPVALLQSILQLAGPSGGTKRDSSLLSLMAAGAARPKVRRDKTNSPCFAC